MEASCLGMMRPAAAADAERRDGKSECKKIVADLPAGKIGRRALFVTVGNIACSEEAL